MGMAAFFIPDVIRAAAEGMLGKSVLPHYKAMRDAQEAGQQIPADAVAEFILAANEKLRNRGKTGMAFAEELGKQYVSEGTKLAVILEEISNGKMQARVNDIMAKEKAPTSHVERLMQPAQAIKPELGAFTQKLNQQAQLAAMAPASPAIN